MINLAEREFDFDKFVNMPKCKGRWTDGNGGCLLTAFWNALGLDIRELSKLRPVLLITTGANMLGFHQSTLSTPQDQAIKFLRTLTDALADEYLPNRRWRNAMRYCVYNFTDNIINHYDRGDTTEALDQLFELIEAVWGRHLDTDIVKENINKELAICSL